MEKYKDNMKERKDWRKKRERRRIRKKGKK